MNQGLKPKPVRAIASQVFPPVTGTGAVTEQSAIEMAKNKEVIATATAEPDEVLPEQKDQVVTLAASQLESMLKTAIASVTQDVTKKVEVKFETDIKTLQDQLNKANADLVDAQNQKAAIANVFTALGHSHPVADKSSALGVPAYNKMIESTSDRIVGRMKEWRDRIDTAFSQNIQDPLTGIVYTQRDWRAADRYFSDNKASLRDECEQYCKANGFLKGLLTEKAAATVRTDLLPTLLDWLSASIRRTQSAKFVFWQFAYKDIQFGKGRGDTVQVSRIRDLTAPTSVTETLLPITGPNGTPRNLSINSVSGVLQRRGLNEPVHIPQFFSLYSLLDLEMLVGQKLGKHSQADIDLRIRTRFLATTKVIFNDGGAVTAVPSDVAAGDDGTLTESFLNAAYAYITGTFLVDTDETGNLWLVAPARSLAPLKNSLANNNRYMDKMSTEALTSLFTLATNSDVPTISGYVGTFCGFHIFQSTAYGNGVAGTEGVQTVTFGTGNVTARSVLAGGYFAVARALGLEPEIRRATEDNFQTTDKWTWISDEIVFDLDVDSAINAEQQDRIFELQVVDAPV